MVGSQSERYSHERTVRVYVIGERNNFYRTLEESAANGEPRIRFVGFSRKSVPDLNGLAPDVLLIESSNEEAAVELLSDAAIQQSGAKILFISPHDDEPWIARLLELGVTYCLLRPIDTMTLLRRILQLAIPADARLMYEYRRFQWEREIITLLNEIGVPAHYKGFAYLTTAITLAIEDESLLNQMTGDLYPLVAKSHNVSPAHVERSIRHAIEVTWIRGNMQRIHTLFAYSIDQDKGKPTNGLFIARLADHFRLTFRTAPSA